jgi:hypothetical protein
MLPLIAQRGSAQALGCLAGWRPAAGLGGGRPMAAALLPRSAHADAGCCVRSRRELRTSSLNAPCQARRGQTLMIWPAIKSNEKFPSASTV